MQHILMDTFYIILAAILLKATLISTAPVENVHYKEFPVQQNLARRELTQGYDPDNVHLSFRAEAQQLEDNHHFAKRDTNANTDDYVDGNGPDDDGETLNLAADTVYVPYLRYRSYFGQRRRVYVNRRSSNYPSMVGYADNRDRFPTVA